MTNYAAPPNQALSNLAPSAGDANSVPVAGAQLPVTNVAGAAALQADTSVASFTVSDSAANVQAGLAGLQADTKIASIVLTDATTPTFVLPDSTYVLNGSVLGKVVSSYDLTVTGATVAAAAGLQSIGTVTGFQISDSSANVEAGLSSLATDTKLTAIAFTDATTPDYQLDWQDYTTDSAVLATVVSPWALEIYNVPFSAAAALQVAAGVTTFEISDTEANFQTALADPAALSALLSDTRLQGIVLPQNSAQRVAMTYATYVAAQPILAKTTIAGYRFVPNYPVSAVVSGAPVSAASSLQFFYDEFPPVASFSIADSLSDVVGGLSALAADPGLTGISLTDLGIPSQTVPAGTDDEYFSLLSLISSPCELIENRTGASFTYGYAPSAGVQALISQFTGQNGTGTQVSEIVDFTAGTSLLYAYNPTGTVSQTATLYSAVNAGGSRVSAVVDNTDGTSLVYAYNPATTVTLTAQTWSGINAANGAPAGSEVSDVVDNGDGTALVYAYNPSSSVTQTATLFSGTNAANGAPAGNRVSAVVDSADGTSIVYAYNPSGNVTQTAVFYSGSNSVDGSPTGSVTSVTFDYTNGESAITTYQPGGGATTVDYSGPDGTGSVISGITGSVEASASSGAPADGATIAVSGVGQTIDPGPGAHTIQFLAGASDDALVLHSGASDTVLGFDPAAGDTLDLSALLAEAGANLGADMSRLAGIVTVAASDGSAAIFFDPAGLGGGSQVALLANDAGMVAQIRTAASSVG